MTRSNPAADDKQATLEEFTDPTRCMAIAVHTEKRCQHPAVPGLSVCHSHAAPEDLAQLAAMLPSERTAQ